MRKRAVPAPTLFAGRPSGEGTRTRTFDHLLACAMRMTSEGPVPSVHALAAAAGVSRATAYRYFPSRSKLISAVIDASLGPVREWDSASTDGRTRIDELFTRTFPRFAEFEPQMRAALQLALEHWSAARSGTLGEEQFRRGFRKAILARAAAPLRDRLGGPRFERLVQALSLVYGIESWIVMRDLWGAGDREIESVVRWMVGALVDRALAEAAA